MAQFRDGLYYSKTHEWVKPEGGLARVGISDFAQSELGDLVYAETVPVGRKVSQGDAIGAVESVKMASDIYTPVSGEVVEANTAIGSSPEIINEDAFAAWFVVVRMSEPGQLGQLMDAEAYQAFCANT